MRPYSSYCRLDSHWQNWVKGLDDPGRKSLCLSKTWRVSTLDLSRPPDTMSHKWMPTKIPQTLRRQNDAAQPTQLDFPVSIIGRSLFVYHVPPPIGLQLEAMLSLTP